MSPFTRPKITLRSKFITIFLGLTLIPLVFAMSVTILRVQKLQRENAARFNEQIAATASESVSSFIGKQFQVLKDMGGIQRELLQDTILQDKILERSLFQTEDFLENSIVDWKGYELNRKHRLKVVRQSDLRNRAQTEAFITVREKGIYLGHLYISEGRPFFDIGAALTDTQGNFNGAIFAQVDARLIQDVVKDISTTVLQERGKIYIVNDEGVVIAHPDSSIILKESNFSAVPAVQSLIDKQFQRDPVTPYKDAAGEEVLGNGKEIVVLLSENNLFHPGWFAVVEQPTTVALAAVYTIRRFSIALLIIVFLGGMFVSIIFARRIVRPIEYLHKISVQFGKGRLNTRALVNTNDELQDLAAAFNAMAEKLQQSISKVKTEAKVLVAERNKLDIIISAISDAVIALDLEKKIILLNKTAEQVIGLKLNAVIGKPLHEVIHIFSGNAEISDSEYCPIKEPRFEGIAFQRDGLKIVNASGKIFHVNLITGQIKEGERIGLGYIITLHDVTREQLIERMKSEFVSIAAHQLRTPLSVLKWGIRMLLTGDYGTLTNEQQGVVEKTYDTNETMIKLVNDLLNTARLEEGRYVFKRTEVAIEHIVADTIKMYEKKAIENDIAISYTLPKETLPRLLADADMLKLAFQNIIENAIRYTPRKGRIGVLLDKEEGGVMLRVVDTGVGIPEEQKSRVFGKFFRGTNATRMETNGSGLGLFITKNIIEAHEGKIWFESQEGKGTTFWVELPIAA